MVILGLTGSIGMGKSFAARVFRLLGVPVHDADAAVHRLLGGGGAAVAAVDAAFPGVVRDGAVDRRKLGERVFQDAAALARLEAILHPIVRRATRAWLQCQSRRHRPLVVLDIPLLFETGGERLCDAVVVVSAPPALQAARVLGRSDMTAARFRAILAKQMPDREKRRRADFVVPTGGSKRETLRRLAAIVRVMRGRPPRHWPPRPRPLRGAPN
ncbi:MAG: dephospho-CoA kinase [Rhodospirillales bacterium]|nr:dephospho-CoA kinase [Rhodospirillales bacterium]